MIILATGSRVETFQVVVQQALGPVVTAGAFLSHDLSEP